jgi:hypothetical protein
VARKITREEFVGRLRDVLAIEMTAKKSYEDDIITFRNFQITDTIKEIRDDEEKHIALLKDLIATLTR